MLVYKSKFLIKNGSVSYHPKVTRQTVSFCRSGEREGTKSLTLTDPRTAIKKGVMT